MVLRQHAADGKLEREVFCKGKMLLDAPPVYSPVSGEDGGDSNASVALHRP